MAITIKSCLENNRRGLTYGNRLILPFHCQFISIQIGLGMSVISSPKTYYDFSPSERDVMIVEEENSTSLYFSDHENLGSQFGQYKGGVILVCCDKADDIFDLSKHTRIQLRFRDDEPWVTFIEQK